MGFFLFISGCVEQDKNLAEPANTTELSDPGEEPDWLDYELTDARTGGTFRVRDFEGRPVLLEAFAVWCPTCLKQQHETLKLYLEEGDRIVHISLDVDPNEDRETVREHMQSNGFEWYSAVAPTDMTQKLIDEFGITVVSAPAAPVVLVCENQSSRLINKKGIKSVDFLREELEKGC